MCQEWNHSPAFPLQSDEREMLALFLAVHSASSLFKTTSPSSIRIDLELSCQILLGPLLALLPSSSCEDYPSGLVVLSHSLTSHALRPSTLARSRRRRSFGHSTSPWKLGLPGRFSCHHSKSLPKIKFARDFVLRKLLSMARRF